MRHQNYANHRKNVPLFHFFVLPFFVFYIGWSIDHLDQECFRGYGRRRASGHCSSSLRVISPACSLWPSRTASSVSKCGSAWLGFCPPNCASRIPEFTVGATGRPAFRQRRRTSRTLAQGPPGKTQGPHRHQENDPRLAARHPARLNVPCRLITCGLGGARNRNSCVIPRSVQPDFRA